MAESHKDCVCDACVSREDELNEALAQRDRLLGDLIWALDWIVNVREVPVEDEVEALASWRKARDTAAAIKEGK